MNPKTFISHASEDKARFVEAFAARLRARGIDAWLDRWEMLPGDSLVDKLFEEGIRNAQSVVVVLSWYSADKPWVREEMNAAFVKRVNSGTKLIPVVLDNCRVPDALTSTLWERIEDLTSIDESFERIVAAITGVRDKPPLGNLPGYVSAKVIEVGGLAKIDNLVLKCICELALRDGHEHVDGNELQRTPEMSSLPRKEFSDSLDMLESEHLVSLSKFIGAELPRIRLTTYGFQQYAQAYIVDYGKIIESIASAIVNQGIHSNTALRERMEKPQFLIDHVLALLEGQGCIQMTKYIGGQIRVFDISVKLKRALGA
jgi:hypothetical protein